MKYNYVTRILSYLLTIAMIVLLSACGRAYIAKDAQTQERQENSDVDAVSSASYTTINGTAVGRLRAVADMIQENTDGDLFSIQTAVVYPADGGKLIDYAAEKTERRCAPGINQPH